jgi:hypothetical protein
MIDVKKMSNENLKNIVILGWRDGGMDGREPVTKKMAPSWH